MRVLTVTVTDENEVDSLQWDSGAGLEYLSLEGDSGAEPLVELYVRPGMSRQRLAGILDRVRKRLDTLPRP